MSAQSFLVKVSFASLAVGIMSFSANAARMKSSSNVTPSTGSTSSASATLGPQGAPVRKAPTAAAQTETAAPEVPAVSAAPAALSFSEAYGRILDRNLDVQSQAISVDSQKAVKLSKVGAFTPSLSLVGAENRGNSIDAYTYQGRESAQAVLQANLFRSGTDFAALKAANRDVDATQEKLRDTKLKAEDDAATSLVTFISRTRERQLIQQIVELKQESIKIARERYAKGLLAQQEVDKTQIDLDNAQARLIDADVTLASARAAVSQRLGAFQNVNLDWPWKNPIESGPRTEDQEFKLENRPDYRQANQTVSAEDWRRHAARSDLLPSLDLSASYGSFDLSQQGRHDWSAIMTLTIPVFESFKGWGANAVQANVARQAALQREQIVRNAGQDIEAYRVGVKEARESAVAREKTAKLTERLWRDNLERFRLGRASANELAIDQNRLLDAQILEVEGWATAHLSFEHLCHAMGRSVSPLGVCQ